MSLLAPNLDIKTKPASEADAMPSLPEAHRSVAVPKTGSWIRRFLAFAGPGYLVSVGYMDPGNWATDLEGGAKYGYALLWVILASNLMAILLQTLCARLGLATGRDLAQACRDYYKRPAAIALWLLCEVAIVACDLAEVIGSAVALKLLFHIPLVLGVLITSLDVFALLAAMHFGFRKIEGVVLMLVTTIGACFAVEIFLSRPDWGSVVQGTLVPSIPGPEGFYIALGILGATVMPHNLYLHSAIVQTRAHEETEQGRLQAVRFNTLDTMLALGAAFFVNAAILIVSAAVFHRTGHFGVKELDDAHKLLAPLLGTGVAATIFAIALLASGQSSTVTGTLAGQIVMEGFLQIRIKPWLRRLITRGLAVIPAIILIYIKGGQDTVGLLILSQVVLSMQLPFAIFPLLMFTSDPARMREFVNPLWLKIVGYSIGLVISGLNVFVLYRESLELRIAGHIVGPSLLGIVIAGAVAFSLWVMFGYKEKATEPAKVNIRDIVS